MFRKLLLFFVVSLLIFSRFTDSVQAAGEPALPKETWRCLKATTAGAKTKKAPPEIDLTLTGSGFPVNFPIYIVIAVPPKSQKDVPPDQQKVKQSTGNAQFDQAIFGKDFTKKLQDLGLEIQVPKGANPNQTVTSTDGTLSVIIHMKNPQGHVNYAFFGVTLDEPEISPPVVSNESGSTLQYGTFTVSQKSEGDPQDCTSIRWDPYGRVFDSQSLEPMQSVKIVLLDQNHTTVFKDGLGNPLPNPQYTQEDGMFNFPVPPGTYFLTAQPRFITTHQHLANPNLHPNYVKAYSNIYKPDEPIIETEGNPQQRDIPLDPGVNTPIRLPPVIMSFDSLRIGQYTKYSGYISHPLSIVKLVDSVTNTEYATITSNEFGFWEIVVLNLNIPQNSTPQLVPVKVDLTTLAYLDQLLKKLSSLLNPFEVRAQTSNYSNEGRPIIIEPILSYIEGYAYDKSGQNMPGAKVRVKVDSSGQTYYETTADSAGFFKIGQERLPIFSYHLEFVSPKSQAVTSVTTSEFARRNEAYLTENNLNLMTATKNGQSLYPTITPANVISDNPAPASPNQSAQTNQMNLILTVVVIIVLLGVAGGVLLYIKKKETQSDGNPL